MPEDEDLSLVEAAALCGASRSLLAIQVRSGELEAYKIRGRRTVEWRVTRAGLEAAGHSIPNGVSRKRPTRAQLESTISITAAVARYNVTKSRLVQMVIAGELPGIRVPEGKSSQWRVKPSDVEAAAFESRSSNTGKSSVVDS